MISAISYQITTLHTDVYLTRAVAVVVGGVDGSGGPEAAGPCRSDADTPGGGTGGGAVVSPVLRRQLPPPLLLVPRDALLPRRRSCVRLHPLPLTETRPPLILT